MGERLHDWRHTVRLLGSIFTSIAATLLYSQIDRICIRLPPFRLLRTEVRAVYVWEWIKWLTGRQEFCAFGWAKTDWVPTTPWSDSRCSHYVLHYVRDRAAQHADFIARDKAEVAVEESDMDGERVELREDLAEGVVRRTPKYNLGVCRGSRSVRYAMDMVAKTCSKAFGVSYTHGRNCDTYGRTHESYPHRRCDKNVFYM